MIRTVSYPAGCPAARVYGAVAADSGWSSGYGSGFEALCRAINPWIRKSCEAAVLIVERPIRSYQDPYPWDLGKDTVALLVEATCSETLVVGMGSPLGRWEG